MKTQTPLIDGYVPGLEGVVAARTRLSHVDGAAGVLVIAGYPLKQLDDGAPFEDVIHLLWRGALPNAEQRAGLTRALAGQRNLPGAIVTLLAEAARHQVAPMAALRMAAGALSLCVPEDAPEIDQAIGIAARIPAIIAAYWRVRAGLPVIEPECEGRLDHAANYLWMLRGSEPSPAEVSGLTTYLKTVVDHGLNASTFAARVIVSTGAGLVSTVTGAIGALSGPLHGGAPGPALDMVFDIARRTDQSEPAIAAYLHAMLDRRERLMGFGHRIYRVRDPRADVLGAAADALFNSPTASAGDRALYALAKRVEAVALRVLAERHPERSLQTNVEFYTALLLHGLNLQVELFSPTFAMSRVVGWLAHAFEQRAEHKIIRPASVYTGALP